MSLFSVASAGRTSIGPWIRSDIDWSLDQGWFPEQPWQALRVALPGSELVLRGPLFVLAPAGRCPHAPGSLTGCPVRTQTGQTGAPPVPATLDSLLTPVFDQHYRRLLK